MRSTIKQRGVDGRARFGLFLLLARCTLGVLPRSQSIERHTDCNHLMRETSAGGPQEPYRSAKKVDICASRKVESDGRSGHARPSIPISRLRPPEVPEEPAPPAALSGR